MCEEKTLDLMLDTPHRPPALVARDFAVRVDAASEAPKAVLPIVKAAEFRVGGVADMGILKQILKHLVGGKTDQPVGGAPRQVAGALAPTTDNRPADAFAGEKTADLR